MSETKLPAHITPEMVDAAKEKHKVVKLAELFDGDGNSLQTVLVGNPSANVLNQFERYLDREPAKAKKILIKGVLESNLEIADLPSNDILFSAAFDAAANMLPLGKSVLKNL